MRRTRRMPTPRTRTAIVVAGDFTAGHPGVMSKLDVAGLTVAQNVAPAGAVGDDPILRKFDNLLYVVNRSDGNNITILDATTLALVEQLGTGAGSNPQDVAVVGDELFVPVYGGTGVAVLTAAPRRSTTSRSARPTIPMAIPTATRSTLVGTDLYVSCELLDASFRRAATARSTSSTQRARRSRGRSR